MGGVVTTERAPCQDPRINYLYYTLQSTYLERANLLLVSRNNLHCHYSDLAFALSQEPTMGMWFLLNKYL